MRVAAPSSKEEPTTSATETDRLLVRGCGSVGRLTTQTTTAMRIVAMRSTPAQIHATGGLACVRTMRSSSWEESWRRVASDPACACGLTPKSVALKSVAGMRRVGTSPAPADCTSARNSAAVWYRSNLSLLRECSTTASTAGETFGLMLDGATAGSLMC